MKKLFALVLAAVFLTGVVVSAKVLYFMTSAANSAATEKVVFEVAPGRSLISVAAELGEKNIISDAKLFSLVGRITGDAGRIHVGEYELSAAMKPREIMNVLTSGQSIKHAIVIPEGFNIFEIKELLNAKWPQRGDEFFKHVTEAAYAQKITGLSVQTLEGFLFPETYWVTKYTEAKEIVELMYAQFRKAYESIDKSGPIRLGTLEHVTLASVIEKETGAKEERPMISSVFHNRLQKGMRLQSDPTIIYGLMMETKAPIKNIKKEDITRPTPYNTYTVKALPVAPIANPGIESLRAALQPASTPYLYFVSRNDGTHVFSETYDQHNTAVQNFQINRKARQGKSWRDLNKKKK